MRILHLLSSNAFHGAESMTLQLVRAQRAAGNDARVALFDSGDGTAAPLAARFAADSIPVELFGARGRLDASLVSRLRAHLRAQSIDLLHSHKYKCTLHALLATAGRRVPLVSTYHNWILIDAKLRWYAAIDKRLARFCSACVAVSDAVRAELLRYVPSQRVFKVDNGIDPGYWSSQSGDAAAGGGGISKKPWTVGFVGRLSVEKGADLLIDALQAVSSAAGRPVHALIVGDGPERVALEQRAREVGLGQRIRFAGSSDDTRSAYAVMDVLALPSRVEGLPMTLLEAMSSGVPAVAMPVGEVPRLVRSGSNGWLAESIGAPQFAVALRSALADAAKTKAAGREARRLIVEKYSAGAMSAAYQVIYGELLASASRRRFA